MMTTTTTRPSASRARNHTRFLADAPEVHRYKNLREMYLIRLSGDPTFGFQAREEDDAFVVAKVAPNSPASRAKMVEGMELLCYAMLTKATLAQSPPTYSQCLEWTPRSHEVVRALAPFDVVWIRACVDLLGPDITKNHRTWTFSELFKPLEDRGERFENKEVPADKLHQVPCRLYEFYLRKARANGERKHIEAAEFALQIDQLDTRQAPPQDDTQPTGAGPDSTTNSVTGEDESREATTSEGGSRANTTADGHHLHRGKKRQGERAPRSGRDRRVRSDHVDADDAPRANNDGDEAAGVRAEKAADSAEDDTVLNTELTLRRPSLGTDEDGDHLAMADDLDLSSLNDVDFFGEPTAPAPLQPTREKRPNVLALERLGRTLHQWELEMAELARCEIGSKSLYPTLELLRKSLDAVVSDSVQGISAMWISLARDEIERIHTDCQKLLPCRQLMHRVMATTRLAFRAVELASNCVRVEGTSVDANGLEDPLRLGTDSTVTM